MRRADPRTVLALITLGAVAVIGLWWIDTPAIHGLDDWLTRRTAPRRRGATGRARCWQTEIGARALAAAATVDAQIKSSGLSAPMAKVRLSLPGLGADSIIVGAAELAFGPLLNDPVATMLATALD